MITGDQLARRHRTMRNSRPDRLVASGKTSATFLLSTRFVGLQLIKPFRPNGPSQPPHVLPPPPPASHYQHHSQPSGSHSLSIADLTQGPLNQHQYNTQPPPQSQPPSMATLGQHPMPHHSPSYLQHDRDFMERRERELRERDMREQEMRERQNLELQRHQEEMMIREREARERERQQMERMHREQQEQQRPVQQSHAGSTPLHQPVANRVQNSIYGPNGLLSNGAIGPTQPNGPSSSNNVNIFNTAPPVTESRPTYLHQQGQTNSQQAAQPVFGGGPSPLPASAQLPQGQQPILNVSYNCLPAMTLTSSRMHSATWIKSKCALVISQKSTTDSWIL